MREDRFEPYGPGTARLTALSASLLSLLLLFPWPLYSVQGQYQLYSAYLAWVVAVTLVPVAILAPTYYTDVTWVLWLMRWGMAVSFLIVTLVTQSLDSGDLLSWAGTVLPTFFYEFGGLIAHSGRPRTWLKAILLVSLLSAAPVVVLALGRLALSGPTGLLYGVSQLRKVNPAWPNFVGIMLAIDFFIAEELAERRPAYRWVSAFCILAVTLTLSRTALMALVVGLVLRTLLRGRFSVKRFVGLVAFTALLGLVIVLGKGVLPQSSLNSTVAGRVDRWKAAVTIWQESPWLGTGYRSFSEAVPSYFDSNSRDMANVGSAHNDYMDLLVRGGAVGLGTLMSFLVAHFVMVGRRGVWKTSGLVRLSLIVTLVTLSIAAVQEPLKSPTLAPLFWTFLGVSTLHSDVRG